MSQSQVQSNDHTLHTLQIFLFSIIISQQLLRSRGCTVNLCIQEQAGQTLVEYGHLQPITYTVHQPQAQVHHSPDNPIQDMQSSVLHDVCCTL